MSKWIVTGGNRLSGELVAQGSKNAALPILAATLLVEEPITLKRCPRLRDVENMCRILSSLGCKTVWEGDALTVDASGACVSTLPDALSGELRSSIFLLGSVLSRFSEAVAPYPGGCEIGQRPIDLHLYGLKKLSAVITEDGGTIRCTTTGLRGAEIDFDYPSVGATENCMLAACKAEGETVLRNAAREPEIVDLQKFLNACGFQVSGAGTSTVKIRGVRRGHGTSHTVVSDRIVTGTYLMAGAMTHGAVTVTDTDASMLNALLNKLEECGCSVRTYRDAITVRCDGRIRELHRVETQPYPGFPTDLQAQLFALLSMACGTSVMVENVFENRFKHAGELKRMGAYNTVCGRTAIIRGVERLHGATVTAHDLRGGAALVMAGLAADGITVVEHIERIERGYEKMTEAVYSLGGSIEGKDE